MPEGVARSAARRPCPPLQNDSVLAHTHTLTTVVPTRRRTELIVYRYAGNIGAECVTSVTRRKGGDSMSQQRISQQFQTQLQMREWK